MESQVPPTPAPAAALSIASGDAGDLEGRWAAWQARGLAHDRAFRHKMTIALPVLLIAAAVVAYLFLGR